MSLLPLQITCTKHYISIPCSFTSRQQHSFVRHLDWWNLQQFDVRTGGTWRNLSFSRTEFACQMQSLFSVISNENNKLSSFLFCVLLLPLPSVCLSPSSEYSSHRSDFKSVFFLDILITNPNILIPQFYFLNKTLHVSDNSSVHHQEFFTLHSAMVYVIQVCWQLASRIRTEPVPSWSCSQAVWHTPLLCVQLKTPDDGQWKCPKHVEIYSKNKFEELVHLVGFIIRIYHDARSHERQNCICIYIYIYIYKYVYIFSEFTVSHAHDNLIHLIYKFIPRIRKIKHTELNVEWWWWNSLH